MANSSMLVLPRMTTPGLAQPACHGGVVRRAPALEDAASRRWSARPSVVMTSLSASGTPASGPSGSPAARCASTRGRLARRRPSSTCRKACTLSSTARDPVEVGLGDLDGARARRMAIAAAVSAAVSASQVGRGTGALTPPPRGCAGTRKRPSSAAGAPESACSWVSPGRTSSARITLVSGSACEVGGTSAVSIADPGDGADDRVELAAEVVELVVVERQPREPGQVGDLVAGDRHAAAAARHAGRAILGSGPAPSYGPAHRASGAARRQTSGRRAVRSQPAGDLGRPAARRLIRTSPARRRSRSPAAPSRCPVVSTPSATTRRPSECPRSTMERTIAASSASDGHPLTNERSTLISRTGSRLRCTRDE